MNRDALIRAILSHRLRDPAMVENSMTGTDRLGEPLPSYVDAAELADHIIKELEGPPERHLEGWAQGHLQAHLGHSHPDSPVPLRYDMDLDAIHRQLHEQNGWHPKPNGGTR